VVSPRHLRARTKLSASCSNRGGSTPFGFEAGVTCAFVPDVGDEPALGFVAGVKGAPDTGVPDEHYEMNELQNNSNDHASRKSNAHRHPAITCNSELTR
jgi:hypothetical protein